MKGKNRHPAPFTMISRMMMMSSSCTGNTPVLSGLQALLVALIASTITTTENSAVVLAQQQITCSSDEVNAYIACVADNPCLCSNCDDDPTDNVPEIPILRPPVSCQDISRVFCPLIKCCSACEEEAAAWYACGFQGFAQSTLNRNCPQNCPGYNFLDFEGDCEEVEEEVPSPPVDTEPEVPPVDVVCNNEWVEYTNCVVQNAESPDNTCSPNCQFDISWFDNSANFLDPCGNEEVFCPLLECCSDCESELKSLASCIQQDHLEVSDEDGDCSLVCESDTTPGDEPVSSPPAPVTEPPAVSNSDSQPVEAPPVVAPANNNTQAPSESSAFNDQLMNVWHIMLTALGMLVL